MITSSRPLKHLTMAMSVISALVMTACAPETDQASVPSGKQTIETGIQSVVQIEGEPFEPLLQRLERKTVIQTSVAVFREGELDWADGYGLETDADTLFQAASMSKVVAATGIATFAMSEGVSLDEDISADFIDVDMEALNPEGLPITLRGLLSHTNGATVHGFPGYAAGVEKPSNLEVVTGSERTNTSAVTINPEIYGNFQYSGGGFQLAQLWTEQRSGQPFDALMKSLILEPVGMERSTFTQPLPVDRENPGNVALAHSWTGQAIEGGWHDYPEMAAAGLWTTPTEYGRFVMALVKAYQGDAGTGLDPSVVREVATPIEDDYGLGVGVIDKDGQIVFRHSGGNEGYRCYFEAYPGRNDAIIVMSGSPSSFATNADIVRTAKRTYGWPISDPRIEQRHSLSETELARFEGHYENEGGNITVDIYANAPDLLAISQYGTPSRLVPLQPRLFIDPDDAQEISFTGEDDNLVLNFEDVSLSRTGDAPARSE